MGEVDPSDPDIQLFVEIIANILRRKLLAEKGDEA